MGNVTVAMGRYTKIKTGKLDANASSVDGAYPFFTCSREPLRISDYSYDCECVLVAGNGDLNVKYYFGKFDAYQRTYIIESIDKRTLDTRYLFYFLDKYVEKLREQAIGGVIKYIKLGYLTDAQIPLPPLPVQRQIANVLDRASALIEKRKAQIAKLDLLMKSQFVEMFGDFTLTGNKWRVTLLGQNADIVSGVTKGRKLGGESTEIPYLRVANVKDGYLDLSEIKTIPATASEIDKYCLQNKDVLMTEGGDPDKLGRGAIWGGQISTCIHQNHIFRVRLDMTIINPLYFTYYLQQPYTKQYFLRSAKQTTGIASINMTQLKGLPVHIPPLDLQNEFAALVERVETQKALLQKSLAKLELNYKSLMQKCFSGEIF